MPRWIRPVKRIAIYLRDGYRCLYCECDMSGEKRGRVTLDHIKPLSAGGSNSAHNLVTCCAGCNFEKSSQTAQEFATVAAWQRIRRNRRRSLRKHKAQARIILARGK